MSTTPAACVLCAQALEPLFSSTVLGRYVAEYHRCAGCGSVFLPGPTWLDHAYSDAISALDVGLLERCLQLSNITYAVLRAQGLSSGTFLDFAGGYGTLTRLMRDRGLDFRHNDPMCANVFAQGHEGDAGQRYDAVTAFEVLEHLTDPAATLAPLAATTDLLLVSTELLPDPVPPPGSWAYYAPDSGQHVTFYSRGGLAALGAALGMQVTSSGRLVHALHRGPLRLKTRALLRDERLAYAVGAVTSELGRRRGLTGDDHGRAVVAARGAAPARGQDD